MGHHPSLDLKTDILWNQGGAGAFSGPAGTIGGFGAVRGIPGGGPAFEVTAGIAMHQSAFFKIGTGAVIHLDS